MIQKTSKRHEILRKCTFNVLKLDRATATQDRRHLQSSSHVEIVEFKTKLLAENPPPFGDKNFLIT